MLRLLSMNIFFIVGACGANNGIRQNSEVSHALHDIDYETIRKLLLNQATEGPNCVSAALMGKGGISTPFNILPSHAKDHIFSQCFIAVDSIQEGDVVALHLNDVIFHVFLKIGIEPGVFSKPNGSEPYELTSMSEMGHCLSEQGEIKDHCSSYRLNLSPQCPLTAYEAYLRKLSPQSVSARSSRYLKKVFGLTADGQTNLQKSEVVKEMESLQNNRLLVDIDGNVSNAGIDVTFLHAEMLNNTRNWLNRDL